MDGIENPRLRKERECQANESKPVRAVERGALARQVTSRAGLQRDHRGPQPLTRPANEPQLAQVARPVPQTGSAKPLLPEKLLYPRAPGSIFPCCQRKLSRSWRDSSVSPASWK